MGYLAYIDYKSLEHPLFLEALAAATANQDPRITPRIFIHGDSEYTERLIQTGMMREDARSRAIRELNRRLVALFADHGVSAIGLNGYQRKFITFDEKSDTVTIDRKYLNSLPKQPILIVSNLVHIVGEKQPQSISMETYLAGLRNIPEVSHLFTFSRKDSATVEEYSEIEAGNTPHSEKNDEKRLLPDELTGTSLKPEIITTQEFSQL